MVVSGESRVFILTGALERLLTIQELIGRDGNRTGVARDVNRFSHMKFHYCVESETHNELAFTSESRR